MQVRFVLILLLSSAASLLADWRDDIGYNKLAAELGAAMPTGAGITLIQSEANNIDSPPNYLPQAGGPGPYAGIGTYADKTFFAQSGAGTDFGHAQSVSSFYYVSYSGVARGATQIHLYTATDFLSRLTSGSMPEMLPGRVQNHSWAGSYGSSAADQDALRNLDLMIHRDGSLVAVPLFNGAAMKGLMGNNYHAITVGLRSGNHSLGGTNTDGNGRMKPDLVVHVDLTSYASPTVAGSAALLLQEAIASGNTNAEKPQTIKAILTAAASKKPFPQWQRDITAEPYDDVFGAGELSLYNAWHIQHAGEHAFSTTAGVPSRGWDFAVSTNTSAGRRYFFTIPAGQVASTFSAALTWHRIVTGLFSLPDLTLKLYAASGLTAGTLISTSNSSVDNVEHLFHYHLPAGQYMMEVTATANNISYAIAWDAQLGAGPQLTAARDVAGQITLAASELDPMATYTIESSPTLLAPWSPEQTFRTADATPAFQYTWQSTPTSEHLFYRLRWTPVR